MPREPRQATQSQRQQIKPWGARRRAAACLSLSLPAGSGGIKRHDDRKPLHSSAKNGTYRQNAAHNAAQVHCLRQYITSAAGLLWLALRLRRLPRFPRRLDSGSFFGAAQDGIERHDDGKPLHSTAESGIERQKAAHNAAQVHSLPQFIDSTGSGT